MKYLHTRLGYILFGCLFVIQIIFGSLIFYYFFDLVFPDIYDFDVVFNRIIKVAFVIVSLLFLLGAESYIFYKYKVNKKVLREIYGQLRYYNELISKSSDLNCLVCNNKSKVKLSKFSWKYNFYFIRLRKPGFRRKNLSLVPFCQTCSQNFVWWRSVPIIRMMSLIPLLIVFIITVYFISIKSPLFVVTAAGVFCLLCGIFRLDNFYYDPNNHIRVSLQGELTVKPKNSNSWLPYDDWIRSATLEE